MTIKKNLENERDTRWRNKGGVHKYPRLVPKICPDCNGMGYTQDVDSLSISDPHPCSRCDSSGEVWE